MSTSSYYPYTTHSSLPLQTGSGKPNPYTSYQRPAHSAYTSSRERSLSPPESRGSTSFGGSLYSSVKSRENYAASLAGSDYDSSHGSASGGASSVDLLDYMNHRLSEAYDPLPLDRQYVRQAQL
jgi:hypothetical protein